MPGGTGYQPVAPGYQPGAYVHTMVRSGLHKKVRLAFESAARQVGAQYGQVAVPPLSYPAVNSVFRVQFTAGSVAQPAQALLTVVDGQSLPGLLPVGWSPLAAFWLELDGALLQPATARWLPEAVIPATETVTLAQWDTNSLVWRAAANMAGDGTNALAFHLPSGGAYALVVRDAGAGQPPVAAPGQPLFPGASHNPNVAGLRATGVVSPPASAASTEARLVTATATVTISNVNGALPSGTAFTCEIREEYLMRDGTRRVTPRYDTSLVGYQRPGPGAGTLTARFPQRPLLVLGGEELQEARVTVDVLAPSAFGRSVIETNGGLLVSGGVQVLSPNNVPVAATFSLNLAGTSLTLLPTDSRPASSHFTIQLSTNITDLHDLSLEGPVAFGFTTESDALSPAAAQPGTDEPTNGLAPVYGTPGSTDPESPVILVNETSGATSTVLSNPDGRFAFFGVPLGAFTIQADNRAGLTRMVAGVLDQPGQTNDVRVVLGSVVVLRTELPGRVVEADNVTPHANATVFVGRYNPNSGRFEDVVAVANADNDGHWRAPNIPANTYDVVGVSVDGKRKGERRNVAAPAGLTNQISIALQGFGIVVGRVETVTGEPVQNALVAGGEVVVRTDTAGTFRLTGVPTGLRTISAGVERSRSGEPAKSTPAFGFHRVGSARVNVLPRADNFVVVRFDAKRQRRRPGRG